MCRFVAAGVDNKGINILIILNKEKSMKFKKLVFYAAFYRIIDEPNKWNYYLKPYLGYFTYLAKSS